MAQQIAQKTSLASRLYSVGASAVSAGWNRVEPLAQKVSKTWEKVPRPVQALLPLGTAAVCASAQGNWAAKGALGLATLCSETPKSVKDFLLHKKAIKLGTQRFKLFNDPLPENPAKPLVDLDKKVREFEKAAVQPLAVSMTASDLTLNAKEKKEADEKAERLESAKGITNVNLSILTEKISQFGIFQTMLKFSGVASDDSVQLLHLVDRAAHEPTLSLQTIFNRNFKEKMGYWGWIKANIAYFLFSSIIQKVTRSYLQNILKAMRVNLTEKGGTWKEFINGLITNTDNFLEKYNGAAETYVKANPLKGNLDLHRQLALSDEKDAPGLREAFYKKLSASIMDHFAPEIPFITIGFGFLNRFLNKMIKWQLRKNILPSVFLDLTDQSKKATQDHNIPFFLALTTTLREQISKIEDLLKKSSSGNGSANLSPLIGIESEHFAPVVQKFLRAVDLAPCKTTDDVRSKLKEMENRWKINPIRGGIEKGIQKGLSFVLYDYLSKQENMEEFLGKLCESIAIPLSGKNIPMNPEQWVKMATEYEAAKILLKDRASSLAHILVKEAVEEKVPGGSSYEATEKQAQEIFKEHKERGVQAFTAIHLLSQTLSEKIEQSKNLSSIQEIYPELNEIVLRLKTYEDKERVEIDIEQNPATARLPQADKESILGILYPRYEEAEGLVDSAPILQNLQKQLSLRTYVGNQLEQIEKTFVIFEDYKQILSKNPLSPISPLIEQIGRAAASLQEIERLLPLTKELASLKNQIESIRQDLLEISLKQKPLAALNDLQPFPIDGERKQQGLLDRLNFLIQRGDYIPVDRWQCLKEIRRKLKAAGFSAAEQKQIDNLLGKLQRDRRPNANRDIWNGVSNLLDSRKRLLEADRNQIGERLKAKRENSHAVCRDEKGKMNALRQESWNGMDKEGKVLHQKALHLKSEIEKAQKEILTLVDGAQLGQILGGVGFVLGAYSQRPGIGALLTFGGRIIKNGLLGKKLELAVYVAALPSVLKATYYGMNPLAWSWIAQEAGLPTPLSNTLSTLVGAAGAAYGWHQVGSNAFKETIEGATEVGVKEVDKIFKTAYDEIITSPIVINGVINDVLFKPLVQAFPPLKKI